MVKVEEPENGVKHFFLLQDEFNLSTDDFSSKGSVFWPEFHGFNFKLIFIVNSN